MEIWRRVGRVRYLILLVFACLLGLTPSATAQSESGVIVGTVRDAQGGVLPGATITLRNVESGVMRTATSESNGTYRLPGLPPGRYALTAELPGFANAAVTDLTITIGLELQRDLTMALQSIQETVSVTAEAPVVETTQTEVAAVVTQEQIEGLPVANRLPISLALLLPGTSMNNLSGRRPTATIGAGGGNGGQMNLYYADGGMNMSNNSGQQHLEVPQSAVREFKVNISQGSAEFNAVGGVVQVATKSGTNQFHGEAFEFFRDKSLNAFDKLEKELNDRTGEPKPDYRRHSAGVAFGGPIIRDRLHFFASFERAKEEERAIVETGQPQFYSALEGSFPRTYMRRAWLARVDYQINQQQSLFWRYVTDLEHIVCEDCGGFNAANVGANVWSPRDSNLVAHTWVIGSRILNEVRVQLPPSHLDNRNAPPGVDFWPADRKGEFPPERFQDYTRDLSVSEPDVGLQLAVDELDQSAGIPGRLLDLDWESPAQDRRCLRAALFAGGTRYQPPHLGVRPRPVLRWLSGGHGQPAEPDSVHGDVPAVAAEPREPLDPGLRADQWRVRPNVTVDLGLRYDNQFIRSTITSVWRAGSAWVSWSIRGRAATTTTSLPGSAWRGM